MVLPTWTDAFFGTLPIFALCFAAKFLDPVAMVDIFFPRAKDVRRARKLVSGIINWLISLTFTASFLFCVASYMHRIRTGDVKALMPLFPFIVCFLTMGYLIALFACNHVFKQIDSVAQSTPVAAVQMKTPALEVNSSQINNEQIDDIRDEYHDSDEVQSTPSNECTSTCTSTESTSVEPKVVDTIPVVAVEEPNPNTDTIAVLLLLGSVISPLLFTILLRAMNAHPNLLPTSNADVIDAPDLDSILSNPLVVPSFLTSLTAYPLANLLPSFASIFNLTTITCLVVLLACMKYLLTSTTPRTEPARFEKTRSHTYLPPFPNGWYKLLDSKQLKRGQIQQISALGLELVAYRTDDEEGRVAIMDAYCVHMGANLAVGGVVKGGCIECPFHRWQFGTDGNAKVIPYTPKIPALAKQRTYPVHEYMDMICMYFDAEGRDPPYLPLHIPDVDEGKYVYRGEWNSRDISMHIQEFAENSADFQHFQPLHGNMTIPWTDFRVPFITITHNAQWIPQQEENMKHIALFKDHAYLNFMGHRIPRSDANATITFMGPAGICYFQFNIEGLGSIVLIQTHLPLAPLSQRTQFRYYAQPHIPRLLVHYVVGSWISQWKNDIDVWENKIYQRKPVLVKGDGPLMALRRWYQQFYSESSRQAGQSKLEW